MPPTMNLNNCDEVAVMSNAGTAEKPTTSGAARVTLSTKFGQVVYALHRLDDECSRSSQMAVTPAQKKKPKGKKPRPPYRKKSR